MTPSRQDGIGGESKEGREREKKNEERRKEGERKRERRRRKRKRGRDGVGEKKRRPYVFIAHKSTSCFSGFLLVE